jgi:uncharacterized surface protein with fasciclin (FAS1) repeats
MGRITTTATRAVKETPMRKLLFATLLSAAALSASVPFSIAPLEAKTVTVGGAPMYSDKNIIENAVNSKDHTTLVAAVKAAGLVETLQGAGPFTVFAPTNSAFARLPDGTVDTLLKPENKQALTDVLTYHVIAGDYSAKKLLAAIAKGGGKARLKTVEGKNLTFRKKGKGISITDQKGDVANVTIADVNQSNGVIHVVNRVLLP